MRDADRLLPASAYDQHAEFYLEFVKRCNRGDLPDGARLILELLGDVDGLRMCDLACGEGYLSRILSERAAAVTGVDLSEKLLAHAQKQGGGVTYIRDDAQVLGSLTDASMDAVVCNMALMDIPDLNATVASVRRILTDRGTFVFCILHPCFFTPFNAQHQPLELDAAGRFRAHRTYRHSDEGKWFSDGSGMCGTLGGHHRMLSTYVNCLGTHGQRISDMREPVRPIGQDETPEEQHDSVVPAFLFAKADVVR